MKRQIRIDGDTAYVPLTQGYEALIDADDVGLVSGHNWAALLNPKKRNVYARHTKNLGDGKYKTVQMHRLLLGFPNGMQVDHIDGNGLNNRRCNLRTATQSQNMHNRFLSKSNKSGVRGVCWCKRTGKWRVGITLNKKQKHIGYFSDLDEATAAYAAASLKYHGAFGRCHKRPEDEGYDE